ncbi:MAG TPA: hypothetical protein VN577_17315 [Terriglobales bacterium]|nr:hypothetical protein [Terriglobales bacterium]
MKAFIPIQTYLALVVNIGLFLALATILRRPEHRRDFPAFSAFILFKVISESVLLLATVFLSIRFYFYAYWLGQLFTFALLFCVVHEVFDSVTDRARWLPRSMKLTLIRMATCISAVFVAASLHLTSNGPFPIMEGLIGMQRGLGMAVFGFMAVTIMFSRSYSVPWQERDTGIAVGIVAAFAFQTFWPRVSAFLFGAPQQKMYMQVVPVFDTVALIIWIYSFWHANKSVDVGDEPAPGKLRLVKDRKNGCSGLADPEFRPTRSLA